jgi:hypothetical protein
MVLPMDNPLEKDIQRKICDWLALMGYFFWRSNNIPVFGRSNDGVKRFRALPKYTPKGLPDIICIKKGWFIGIEVKRQGFKASMEQLQMGASIVSNGGLYFVVTSLPEVMTALKENNL